MKRKTIIGLLVVALALVAISLPIAKKKEGKVPEVKTMSVEKGEVKSYLSTTGIITSKKAKEYYGPQSKASEVNFKVGDKVKDGDIIVSYDMGSIDAEFNGTITEINVLEGTIGNMNQPAVVVQDLDNLKIEVGLGKFDAHKVKVGQSAEVKFNGKSYKAKVEHVDPVAKQPISAMGSGETTLKVELSILDNIEGLMAGFDVDVNILLGEKKEVIKVPAEAIKADKSGKNFIYILEDNKAVEKEIKLGLESDMESEVLSGIEGGEKIILNPNNVNNGDEVRADVEEVK